MRVEKKYVIYGLVVILILVMSVSLAYFQSRIVGDKKDVVVNSKDLKVIYTGGTGILTGSIEPGFSTSKTFTVKNESGSTYKYDIVIKDLVNTFVTSGFLQYKITSTDGGYNMSNYVDIPKRSTEIDTVLAYSVSINNNSTHTYTLSIVYTNSETVDQSDDMGKEVSGSLYIKEGSNPTLAAAMLRDNPTISERTQFDTELSSTTNTIYKTNKTEDGSLVYYYSDATTNNWVKFGKYTSAITKYRGYASSGSTFYKEYDTLTECNSASEYNTDCTAYTYANANDDMYWRIIRTNEDGSVRLLYSGTSTDTTETSIGKSAFNADASESRYVGYMYGGNTSLADNRANTTDSTIKGVIDTWYQNNLLESYDKYISKSAIYCNDRSISRGDWANKTDSQINFGIIARVGGNSIGDPINPSYKCGANTSGGLFETTQAVSDKFSASTTGGGNGQLTYPVALITADELAFIGMYYTVPFTYDNGGAPFWTMTPYESYDVYGSNSVYALVSKAVGASICPMEDCLANGNDKVRPVLSISSCAKFTGTGTTTDPYTLDTTNSTC